MKNAPITLHLDHDETIRALDAIGYVYDESLENTTAHMTVVWGKGQPITKDSDFTWDEINEAMMDRGYSHKAILGLMKAIKRNRS